MEGIWIRPSKYWHFIRNEKNVKIVLEIFFLFAKCNNNREKIEI